MMDETLRRPLKEQPTSWTRKESITVRVLGNKSLNSLLISLLSVIKKKKKVGIHVFLIHVQSKTVEENDMIYSKTSKS